MHLLPILSLLSGICGSFFFAGVETGYISWNPVKAMYQTGRGGILYRFTPTLLKNKELVLATVLIGNNIAIVVATLAFERVLYNLNEITSFNFSIIPSPDLIILTPFLVIFSEILPKSLFRIYSFRLTKRAVPILTFLYFIFFPITFLLASLSKVLAKGKIEDISDEKRKEVSLLANEASRKGSISNSSKLLVENTLELKNILISDLSFLSQGSHSDIKKSKYKKLSSDTNLLEFISQGLGVNSPYYIVNDKIVSSFRINSYLFSIGSY